MGKQTQLNPQNEYQIHKGKIVESKSDEEEVYIEDLGHIESRQLKEYDGLTVTDITDDEEYSFQSFDSGNRLVQTDNGEFLIVHSRTVETGPWSFNRD